MEATAERGPGAVIRSRMAEKGLTPETLARKLGVTPNAVKLWMGGNGPNRGNLNRLAKVLGCRPGELI